MAKNREQMIDKMASKFVPKAKKLGGEEKEKSTQARFDALKGERRKKMRRTLNTLFIGMVLLTIVGCQTASQPGRTNSQELVIKDNSSLNLDQSVRTSVLALPAIPPEGFSSNAFAQVKELVLLQKADGGNGKENNRTYGDVLTLNLMSESRDEQQTPTATSVPSTSVPINVAWGASTLGGGSSSATEAALWEKFKQWMSGSSTNGPSSTQTTGSTAAATAASGCSDGSCTIK